MKMKTFESTGIVRGLALLTAIIALPAAAQFNQWSEPRYIVAANATQIAAASGLTTNNPIDTHGYEGIATLNIFSLTNSAGGTLTVLAEQSDDLTNWTALTYALSSSATIIYTNSAYGGGTNFTATNTMILPYTIVSPTAATAGFATPYPSPAQFTNTAALTVTAKGFYQMAYNVADAKRYLHLVWTPAGTATNITAAALLIARKQQFP